MKATHRSDSVRFSVKGQVVIPSWLRKDLDIEEGTRAIVRATPEGILLKPVTRSRIRGLRGMLKRRPGAKPFAQEWAEYKEEERALEEAKHARIAGPR